MRRGAMNCAREREVGFTGGRAPMNGAPTNGSVLSSQKTESYLMAGFATQSKFSENKALSGTLKIKHYRVHCSSASEGGKKKERWEGQRGQLGRESSAAVI